MLIWRSFCQVKEVYGACRKDAEILIQSLLAGFLFNMEGKGMKQRIIIWLVAIFLVLLAFSFAYAEDVITREYEFQTSNPRYESYTVENIGSGDLEEIPATVENGFFTVKHVTDIKIKLLSEEVPEKIIYEKLIEKKLPENTGTIQSGEKELSLLETNWEEEKRGKASGTLTKKGYDNEPEFPDTKVLTVTLTDGSEISTIGKLKDVRVSGASYSKDFSVSAKFIGDPDVSHYDLEGTLIPNNPATPEFKGFEEIILSHFGMNPDRYNITSGTWTTDYVEEDGVIVRYAEFSGRSLANDWTAYYEEDLTASSPSPYIYTATCYYGENMDPLYNVHVSVEYGKTEIIAARVAAASVSLVVLAGLIVFILMFLGKKKKSKDNPAAGADNSYF